MARFLITALSFIDNQLIEEGKEITLDPESTVIPGSHWQPLDAEAEALVEKHKAYLATAGDFEPETVSKVGDSAPLTGADLTAFGQSLAAGIGQGMVTMMQQMMQQMMLQQGQQAANGNDGGAPSPTAETIDGMSVEQTTETADASKPNPKKKGDPAAGGPGEDPTSNGGS